MHPVEANCRDYFCEIGKLLLGNIFARITDDNAALKTHAHTVLPATGGGFALGGVPAGRQILFA